MLSEEQKALTKRARAIASQVEGVEVKEDNLLEDILADHQSTFSIVVAGEFNSGKSTLSAYLCVFIAIFCLPL